MPRDTWVEPPARVMQEFAPDLAGPYNDVDNEEELFQAVSKFVADCEVLGIELAKPGDGMPIEQKIVDRVRHVCRHLKRFHVERPTFVRIVSKARFPHWGVTTT